MKLIIPANRAAARSRIACEWCRAHTELVCAHIYSRGAGWVDIPANLCGLCWRCHQHSHGGHEPTRDQLLVIAAGREGTTPEAITEEVHRIRRIDKLSVEADEVRTKYGANK